MDKIKDIMDRKVVTVKKNAPVQEVSKMLIKSRLSGVPVVDAHKRLAGFISERDIIAAISTGVALDARAEDIMVKNVVSVKESASVEQISQVFTTHPFRYIPVVSKRRIIGIISRKDVIEKLLGQYY